MVVTNSKQHELKYLFPIKILKITRLYIIWLRDHLSFKLETICLLL